VSRISSAGISVDVPGGWEGTISDGGFRLLSDGAREPTVLHVGSFPLPDEGASFGAFTVGLMGSDDVFIVLFEYGPDSANTPLFASQEIPRRLEPADFSRDALQRGIPGQSGVQRFFTTSGRAFCLYVVLGSHIDRAELVARVNSVLETLEID